MENPALQFQANCLNPTPLSLVHKSFIQSENWLFYSPDEKQMNEMMISIVTGSRFGNVWLRKFQVTVMEQE
jgi:hypothetical protein